MAMKFKIRHRGIDAAPPFSLQNALKTARNWLITLVIIAAVVGFFYLFFTGGEESIVKENASVEETTPVENTTREVEKAPEVPILTTSTFSVDLNTITNENCDEVKRYAYFRYVFLAEEKERYEEHATSLKNKETQLQDIITSLKNVTAPVVTYAEVELSRVQKDAEQYEELIGATAEDMKQTKDIHDELEEKCR